MTEKKVMPLTTSNLGSFPIDPTAGVNITPVSEHMVNVELVPDPVKIKRLSKKS
jgi:hypothetical protein